MADKQPTRATRLPESLDERYTDFRDGQGMTNSEALRALIRAGLEVETADDEEESDAPKTPGTGSEWLLFVAGALAGLLSSILLSSDSEEALVAWAVSGAAYGLGGLPALRWVAAFAGAYVVIGLFVKIARELWRSADTPEVSVDA
jgi:hypothetical protein